MNKKLVVAICCLLVICIIAIICFSKPKKAGYNEPYEVSYKEDYEDYSIIDPYETSFDEELVKKYIEKIDEIEKNKRDEILKEAEKDKNSIDYSNIKNTKYDLIFLNDDNVPELVAGEEDSYVSIYTIVGDKVVPVGDEKELLIGVDGNQLYEYIPKGSIVYNMSTDYAGLVSYYNFRHLNKNNKFEDLYSEKLYSIHFEDINNNKIPDNDERQSLKITEYYFGDKKLSEEEYLQYKVTAYYENLMGKYNKDEMKEKIEELIK